ncbi:teichuronopeptide biosynthesis TupA-like protein [Tenacibaculum adriaticum]|uniref:Teichuronopeptide biosynthesis TupA-like protein n=1 Tax=Tenacibaculum adriaticum TaxID=413713 RepID=A0A5S5DSB1_9FLAO|nr:ATP-grasp fold amidoligase family protein [Tenacibaculum adriaticum]TYP98820.1 teichuronopeptide biosynthesis TupA-like protein [Tenacibaculum adriaticum]
MSKRKLWVKMVRAFKFLPQPYYVKYYYEYYSGKKLDYDNPQEFNQKLSWYKVFFRPKILNILVDKYAVREFVEDKIGSKYLNECYGVYESPLDVNFDELPQKFVIKGVHGCNFNLVVEDKNKLNKTKAIFLMKKWLTKNQYYRGGLEWAYKDVKPRIVIEKFLKDDVSKDLIDYKFYCFDGTPKFLVAQSDTLGRYFYDLKWKELPFRWKKEYKKEIEKPSNLDELINLATKLADKFPFVRVDFYSVNNQAYFGEMTFYPTDARDDFYPEEYNKIIGDYFELPIIPKGEKYITKY